MSERVKLLNGAFHAESLRRAEHVTQVKSELGGNCKEEAMVYSKALLTKHGKCEMPLFKLFESKYKSFALPLR
jgi:hypothetical protein